MNEYIKIIVYDKDLTINQVISYKDKDSFNQNKHKSLEEIINEMYKKELKYDYN